jgi:LacI family transcriptional regulator
MTAPPQIAVFIREGVSYNLNILLGTVECRRGRPPWNYRFVYHGDISVSELETGPRVAGVIAQLQYFPELVPVVERRGIPTVDVSPEPSAWKFPQVLPDDVEVGRRAGEFFVGRGFKHFAFLGYDSRYSALRQRGFESVVRRTGGSFASIEEPFSYLYDLTWLQRLRRWLKSLPKPVALMSATDLRSRQLLLACEKSNIRVPEEISVISVDDDESICQLMVPTLSSIPLDGRRAGYETAALLDRMMSGETVPWQSVPIPPSRMRR